MSGVSTNNLSDVLTNIYFYIVIILYQDSIHLLFTLGIRDCLTEEFCRKFHELQMIESKLMCFLCVHLKKKKKTDPKKQNKKAGKKQYNRKQF